MTIMFVLFFVMFFPPGSFRFVGSSPKPTRRCHVPASFLNQKVFEFWSFPQKLLQCTITVTIHVHIITHLDINTLRQYALSSIAFWAAVSTTTSTSCSRMTSFPSCLSIPRSSILSLLVNRVALRSIGQRTLTCGSHWIYLIWMHGSMCSINQK